jgi:ketosteroid isomerase-like protein
VSRENVQALTAVYREWASGNFTERGLFAADVSFEPFPERAVVRGREAVGAYMAEFLRQWSDYRVEARAFTDAGDSIVVDECQYATGKATGIETVQTFYAVWTFLHGRVVRVRWEQDRTTAVKAVGLKE